MIMKQLKGNRGNKVKLIISILIAVILVFMSFFVYRNTKENSYREKYPEFYDIEKYISSLDEEDSLCESLRYNNDGSEIGFEIINGIEEGDENTIYAGIDNISLRHNSYNIKYDWFTTTEKKIWYSNKRELTLVFYLEDKSTLVESRNIMRYDFKSHTQTEEIWYDETTSSTVTEFDKETQEIYDLILEDITKRINQCEK